MKIAIHQPNFMPWLGYFYKIAQADIFVIIDDVQFVKGEICNRNKIKNTKGEAVWITLPVSHKKGLNTNFNEIEIEYKQKWQERISGQLRANYSKAPFFDQYFSEIEKILTKNHQVLSKINIELINYFCEQLSIKTPRKIISEFEQDFGIRNERLINITKFFNGTVYLSGTGAKKYNDEEMFQNNKIKLQYLKYKHPEYNQIGGDFVSHLSILDLLFNCGPKSAEVIFNG